MNFFKVIQFICLFMSLLLVSSPSHAVTRKCSNLLAPKLHISQVYSRSILLDAHHSMTPSGNVRLHDLRLESYLSPQRKNIVDGIIASIRENNVEIDLKQTDGLLALDFRGDKMGFLRVMAENLISQKTLDIIGLESLSVISRNSDSVSSRNYRLVFIIKKDAKDYRDIPDEEKLMSKDDIAHWISNELDDFYSELFATSSLNLAGNSELTNLAYRVMGERPGLSPDSPFLLMPKSDFVDSFMKAVNSVLLTLNAQDLLYIRPGFWEESPKPDSFAIDAYRLLHQGLPIDSFVDGYSKKALLIRKKIYDAIHKDWSRQGRSSGTVVEDSSGAYTRSRGSKDEIHSLPGIDNQIKYGHDFFAGYDDRNLTIESFMEGLSSDSIDAFDNLAQHGYKMVSDLQGADASEVLDRANLRLPDLVTIATELAKDGVYLRYPPSILYKIDRVTRAEIRPPFGKGFEYNPRTNTYRPIHKDE